MQLYHQLLHNPTVKKHLFISILGGIFGIAIYYYLVVSSSSLEETLQPATTLLVFFYGVCMAYVFYWLSLKLDTLLPWKTQIANRLLVGILIHFLSAELLIVGSFYGYNQYVLGDGSSLTGYQHILIKLSILLLVLALLYSIIYFAFYSYYSYATLQIEGVKEERKRIHLQLKALKSQLSPHFLFNSLNTISSLIYKDETKAESYIRQLAKIYQYTLDSYNEKLITLKQELEVVDAYQYLLNTRFENKFHSKIEIPTEYHNTKIPPLTLQMLVENAVKHNVMLNEAQLNVSIKIEDNYIIVANNITQAPAKRDSFNIGLSNIKARYELLDSKRVHVTKNDHFTVKLPLLK